MPSGGKKKCVNFTVATSLGTLRTYTNATPTAAQDRARYGVPTRGPDGHYQPVEQIMPMNEGFPGGFKPVNPDKFGPPPAPPKEYVKKYMDMNGHGKQHPVPAKISAKASASSSRLTHKSAVERSQALRIARMDPHLQLMVGPLLRYDTVDEGGVWHGFALVVCE